MRTVLIDGDTVVFSASSSTETPIQWDAWRWTLHGDLREAAQHLDDQIERIKRDTHADHVVMTLSAPENDRWRDDVMPTYKANRTSSRKPITYGPLRDYVRENYRTVEKPRLEGDDILGILATHPTLVKGEKVIAAIDKDLRTIPGELYVYDRNEHLTITPYEAERFFIKQALMGDRTDGYPGCPGIGPKTADKVLDAAIEDLGIAEPSAGEFWPYVVEAYREKGLGEQVALQNARVARILWATDYDYENEEPILWTPQ